MSSPPSRRRPERDLAIRLRPSCVDVYQPHPDGPVPGYRSARRRYRGSTQLGVGVARVDVPPDALAERSGGGARCLDWPMVVAIVDVEPEKAVDLAVSVGDRGEHVPDPGRLCPGSAAAGDLADDHRLAWGNPPDDLAISPVEGLAETLPQGRSWPSAPVETVEACPVDVGVAGILRTQALCAADVDIGTPHPGRVCRTHRGEDVVHMSPRCHELASPVAVHYL